MNNNDPITQPGERRCEHIILDDSAIQALIDKAMPGCSVAELALLNNGKINTNYRITMTNSDIVVLRLYARDPLACSREAALYSQLDGVIPVPQLICSETEPANNLSPYIIYRWIHGELLADACSSRALIPAKEIGKALGRMANITFKRAGFFDGQLNVAVPFDNVVDAWLNHMEDNLRVRSARRLGNVMTARLLKCVDHHRSLLDEVKNSTNLTHCDFSPWNLVVKDGHLGAIIDWEWASSGCGLADFGNLLREEEQYPTDFISELTTGYREAGAALPEEWKAISLLLDLVCQSDFLALKDDKPLVHKRAILQVARTLAYFGF